MSINYPSSLDTFANPTSTDLMENASPALDHDVQHSNANDAIEALEAKVGADGSAVTTSHDYKLGEVTGTDKAVGKTASQTLTNKTLTSPVINLGSDATGDMYYRNSGGTLTRLPIGTSSTILNVDNVTGLPTWTTNPTGADASTTSKGVVELATLAETLAKTSTGGTGAKLVVTPDNMNSTLVYDYAADSVGSDAYAITLTPAPTAYVTGQRFTFKAGTANTGAATLNVNSLGAKTIKKQYNLDLNTGDILANQIVEVVYDGTNMQMVSQKAYGLTSANGVTTRAYNTASGTQTIAHGLSTTPKYVRITASHGGSMQMQGYGNLGLPTYSIGVYNGTTTSCVYYSTGYSQYTSGASATDTTNIIYIREDNATTNTQVATISVDSTNITLTWTKTGTLIGTGDIAILWEAQV